MSNINFIPENTLRVLYGDNLKFDILDESRDFKDWCEDIKSPFRKDWQNVPEIPVFEVNGTQSDLFKFSYDSKRFNPFHITSNFSKAMHLLDECYALKDSYKEYEVEILDQDAQFKISEKLAGIEVEELLLTKHKLYNISNAQRLKLIQTDGETEYVPDKDDVILSQGKELEIDLLEKKRKILIEEKERLKVASQNPKSPYNKNLICSRQKAKYVHRLTELVMLIEVLKHGLLIVKNVLPFKFSIKEAMLKKSISDYRNFPEIVYDLPGTINDLPKNKISEEEEELLEPETDIRNYLWRVSKILQRERITQDDYIHRVSTKNLVNKTEQENWEDSIRKGHLRFNLDSIGLAGRAVTLLGISAEIILKDEKTNLEVIPNKLYDLFYLNEKFRNNAFKIHVNVPSQSLGNGNKYPDTKMNEVHFMTSAVLKNQSTVLINGASSNFYGRNIVENYNPNGYYNFYFTMVPEIDNLKDVIEDIYLYLHLKIV